MAEYDFVIIGGGAGGFAGAIKASELGARVAIIVSKRLPLGGTCVNVGCVPSKFVIEAAELYHKGGAANPYTGILLKQGKADYGALVSQKNKLVLNFRKEKYINVIKGTPNVHFFEGDAEFISPHEVLVNKKKRIRGHNFLIATGSRSAVPPIKGLNKVKYLTNIEALELRKLPKSMVVIGGGYIGVELGQAFAHLGTKVTILQRGPRILAREEPPIQETLKQYLEAEGIDTHVNTDVLEVRKQGKKKMVIAKVNGKQKQFVADELLVATGRAPNTEDLHVENTGVKTDDKRRIVVDNYQRTNVKHIWAAGDCTNQIMLETVAARGGAIAVENALRNTKKTIDFNAVPHAIFTIPNVASVGMLEEDIQKAGIRCSCRVLPLTAVAKAYIFGDTRGFIKININADTEEILGVHMIGIFAAEVIHEATVLVKNKMKLDDIINMTHIFPTMCEAIKLCAQSFKRDLSKMSCCVE
jgi:mercuric reductase